MIPYCSICWDVDKVKLLDQRRLPAEELYLEITGLPRDHRGHPHPGHPGRTGHRGGRGHGRGVGGVGSGDSGPGRVPGALSNHLPGDCRSPSHRGQSFLGLGPDAPGWPRTMPPNPPQEIKDRLVAEAQTMLKEDDTTNRRMAQAGQVLIHNGQRVLTHCNTGALATGAYGTALGVLRAAWEAGKRFSVWVDETRPLLQGARLTTWELGKLGIPYTLIPDGAAATLMHQGKVDLVILGADRIAANGDTANKIGTYSVAVLAHHHGIPFYVAAPLSTFDFSLPDGDHIPVEERDAEEVTHLWGQAVAPAGAPALNLAFDVTPNELIAGIVTEKGIMEPPFSSSLKPHRPAQG